MTGTSRAFNTCPICGYSLAELSVSGVCPECGLAYDETCEFFIIKGRRTLLHLVVPTVIAATYFIVEVSAGLPDWQRVGQGILLLAMWLGVVFEVARTRRDWGKACCVALLPHGVFMRLRHGEATITWDQILRVREHGVTIEVLGHRSLEEWVLPARWIPDADALVASLTRRIKAHQARPDDVDHQDTLHDT